MLLLYARYTIAQKESQSISFWHALHPFPFKKYKLHEEREDVDEVRI